MKAVLVCRMLGVLWSMHLQAFTCKPTSLSCGCGENCDVSLLYTLHEEDFQWYLNSAISLIESSLNLKFARYQIVIDLSMTAYIVGIQKYTLGNIWICDFNHYAPSSQINSRIYIFYPVGHIMGKIPKWKIEEQCRFHSGGSFF